MAYVIMHVTVHPSLTDSTSVRWRYMNAVHSAVSKPIIPQYGIPPLRERTSRGCDKSPFYFSSVISREKVSSSEATVRTTSEIDVFSLSEECPICSWNLMERVGNPRLCKPVRLYNQLQRLCGTPRSLFPTFVNKLLDVHGRIRSAWLIACRPFPLAAQAAVVSSPSD